MRSLRLAGFAFALCWLFGCGTRRDPDFCCTTESSCAASGVTVDLTPCSDPERPVCDDNATLGADRPRTCIADIGGECTAPGECTDPTRPYCTDNRCVQCEDGDSNDDCNGTTPACNASTHLCGPCTGNPDCAGDPGGPVCNVADGTCVECADASDCPLATAGVCDATDHTCRGCRADIECASGVCHPDSGACAAPTDVLYVEVGAIGTTCTQAQPCGTLAQATALVGGTQRVIKLGPGMHGGSLGWGTGGALVVHGDGAADTTLDYAGPSTTFVNVTGGSTLTIERLKLTGSPSTAPAVRCQGSTVRSFGVHVDAIPRGGFQIDGCSFALANTAVTRSGGPVSTFGAVQLANLDASHTTRFEFNTLLGNAASGTNVAGVQCNGLAAAVALRSSIVFGNGTLAPPVTVTANCPVTYSVLDAATPGATNINTSPGLAAPEFHLAAGSSAIDLADPAATVGWDLDGDQRPAARDSGADER